MRSGKFGFFLSAGLVLAGALMVVLMYIQVYMANSEVNRLRAELTEEREANQIASQVATDSMNMNDLYVFATSTLGMEEADASTTIQIRINSQSYTTSNLPVAELAGSKVTFHWFR
ncbi:MAG: hypothetical protein J6P72_05400 [Firmicutes bacterium]|nr:hypothetical protein [Bacillota bacterium]